MNARDMIVVCCVNKQSVSQEKCWWIESIHTCSMNKLQVHRNALILHAFEEDSFIMGFVHIHTHTCEAAPKIPAKL
jgi:hypothetical protein